MNRSIVTGGAGFIGSALVRALLEKGHRVHVIDNLSTGNLDNLEEVADEITVHEVDLRHYDRIARVIEGADQVFHLGALPSVPKSILDPVPSHESNIDGTFNVFRAATEGKAGRVIYAASSSAYGDTEVLPKVETMAPRPKSPYAVQKLVGEYYATAFCGCFGLETVSLRFFNVFGPRQDPTSVYSGVLSIFLTCLIERRSPTIYGDGEQTRDFTYVEDVVELMLKAAHASGVSGRVFNAGNGNRYTLNETWALLQKIEGIDLPAKYGPPRPGDVRHSQADTSAAVQELGHKPRFTFEQGLRLTLDWYRADLERKTVSTKASRG
ncbi:MAG: SDR family oxidoreductase [Acidobacteriaceae bacterium]|nr:SDR family oxidoreductase [Acidobacteriaceae bacterium]MBV9781335.1 SDR family oxidoreductase [Acidobacteriaceae bacterium]